MDQLGSASRGGTANLDSRGMATRNAILDVALPLFAEHGVQGVSNRQIGAAAGKGNTSVVGYYFESKADLVRELVRRFSVRVDKFREQRIAELGDDPVLRDWVSCLVRPYVDLLADEEPPTWHARFIAQVMTDPGLRQVAVEEMTPASLQLILARLAGCLVDVPAHVLRDRYRIASHVIVQMCAERERALADGLPVQPPSWEEFATGLVDVLVGMWTAAVTAADDA